MYVTIEVLLTLSEIFRSKINSGGLRNGVQEWGRPSCSKQSLMGYCRSALFPGDYFDATAVNFT